MKNFMIPIPEKVRENILIEIENEVKKDNDLDTINKGGKNKELTIKSDLNTKLEVFMEYVKENPEANINEALDTLGYQKNFTNRFLFTRAESINAFSENKETRNQFFNQLLSYGSIALFIFLPIFTLFLKFYYIRRKYTYVDHLIFVFHVQTVFFMLFAFYFIFMILKLSPLLWIFLALFLVYLYLAMKKFYEQGYFKTFLKFLLLNASFSLIASIGVIIVFLISFAFF
ncbi:MAG: hypothetical protein ABF286_04225 [Polaribacter sp.]